jgi:predicted permease
MIERLYRLLLAVLPREFRDRFGTEVLETARAVDRDRRPGLRQTARALTDAVALPFALRAELRRERRGIPARRKVPMESFARDLRFAVRALRREPGFVVFVCATLALGIGANAAMFGIADRLLFRGPTHVRDASRVVRVYSTEQPPGMRTFTTSGFGYVTYDLLRHHSATFDQVATYAINNGFAGQGADARAARIGFVSADLFPLLGVGAVRGRVFTDEENAVTGAARVAVLGHSAWREWFGADEGVLGQTVVLNDERYVVIGVAPAGFTGPELGRVDVWVPGHVVSARITPDWMTSWNSQWLQIVARLKPGVTFAQAGEDATGVHRRGYTGGDATSAAARLSVASLRANSAGAEAMELRILRWLTAVAIVVLLIACANVTNLLLARGVRKAREVAIRAALGAGRFRLARLLLLEALLLALGGAALGLVAALAVGTAARQALFANVEWTSSPVDLRVLVVSTAMALAVGVIVGVIPAIRSSRTNLNTALKTGVRDGGGRRSRLRTGLTVVQAALSVVLLVGAGLFVRSLWNIRSLDLGIDPDRVLVIEVSRTSLAQFPAGPARDAERARRRTSLLDSLDRIRAVPGVERAGIAVGMPFGNRFTVKLRVPGRETLPTLKSGGPSISAVTADYFETVGTAIRRGRAFTPADGAGTEPVAIVSETMAQTIWPGADPIGQCLLIGDGTPPCSRVVGIAENTHRSRLQEDPVMHYYVPVGQETGFGGAVLLVRGKGTFGRVIPELRRTLTAMDQTITYISAQTVDAQVDPQRRPWRLGATVLALSGLLALLVAGTGIYSVLSYLIADRRREIGVRLALGATTSDVVRLIVRDSLAMAVAGILLGELLALSLGGLVEPLLFRTSPRDPLVYVAIGLLLTGVALLASLPPALRARRIPALEALRAE